MMENLADDPSFIDAIVHEVKSQGLFDQFRKECLADVDTKPAYQNLRQRVESSVSKFLSQQKWTENIRHKNQLREKLRKNIIDSGFLETGVERIVDQVVNPKISAVFHPKVEEIVYNYLGIEKPKPVINGSGFDIQTDFMPEDLEAVSPDSDKKSSSASSDILATHEQSINEELNESKENVDDFESPAFEPLETRSPSQTKQESNDSHTSAISGLTSQESVQSEHHQDSIQEPNVHGTKAIEIAERSVGVDEQDLKTVSPDDDILHRAHDSPETAQNDSQLSQVSSNSRLSIITNSEGVLPLHQQEIHQNPRLDIAEEAQMPKFNECPNEEGEVVHESVEESNMSKQPQRFKFDLKKETYEFSGTVRNKQLSENYPDKTNEIVSVDNGGQEIPDKHPGCPSSPTTTSKYEESSTQSERSLRICEDSTLDRRTLEQYNQHDNCDSAKTPLNDEHSTQSAPDVEKMDSLQAEIVSLAVVQQHTEKEKKTNSRDRDRSLSRKHSTSHHHRSSSSRDRRSYSSAKHSSSGRKSDQRDRKSENGKSNSNSGSSKKFHDKKNPDDDHYSSREKPIKKRRSTDRDSNDGTDSVKHGRQYGDANNGSGESLNDTTNNMNTSQKRGGEMHDSQVKTNESLESQFEGFDEEQLQRISLPKIESLNDYKKKSDKNFSVDSQVGQKRSRKNHEKIPKDCARKVDAPNMDVFSFSFEKPAKLRKSDEIIQEEPVIGSLQLDPVCIDDTTREIRQEDNVMPCGEPIDHPDEGIIVLEPTEIERVTEVNNMFSSSEAASTADEDMLPQRFDFPPSDPANLIKLSTKPVVVDQILMKEDNVGFELFIGDKPTQCKDQQAPPIIRKIKKPKIASNFSEARKLMKIRKQMERDERKQREQAKASEKQSSIGNEIIGEGSQMAELESVYHSDTTNLEPLPTRDEEKELLFFPEDNEAFPVNDKLLFFLKQNIVCTIPMQFAIESSKIKWFSLDASSEHGGPSVPNDSLSKRKKDSIEIPENICETQSVCIEPMKEEQAGANNSDCLSKSDNSSINCQMAPTLDVRETSVVNQRTNKKKTGPSPARNVGKMRNNVMDITEVDQQKIYLTTDYIKDRTTCAAETVENIQKKKTGKMKRLGLPKPRENLVNNNSPTFLMVDISDMNTVNTEKKSPTINNNNNGGTIKSQRYSSDDLYKPRPLNGLRTRTRTRGSEGVQTEITM
ncbi:biorientation of chromosomes in cell division protein 1-like 1 [Toxorhynchites rutilus septentrionalis]|uniref:biorientation of chromosomes in cell division protein 1-like 1 n=1 Tax=Toxorhynchites rutilus septentrionalis TaxID=329112 RepID=UPI00247935A7|nr:biorientation of chromosomes in cell division protein 1-like 1 [Toxorhynchites rutilus septentrionalis]